MANSTARSSQKSVSKFALLMRRIDQISDKLSEQIATTTSVLKKKVEVLNQRSLTLELSIKEIRSIVDRQQTAVQQPQQPPTGPPSMPEEPIGNDEENIYIPTDLNDGLLTAHSMSMEKPRLLVTSASSRGNFACRIVENLFPELFGPDNLRYSYSYNDSYFYRKKALDPSRLRILKRYLLYFYPELKDSAVYQRTVIDSVNERLRRPVAESRRRAKSGNVTADPDASHDGNTTYFSTDDTPMYADIYSSSRVLLEMPYNNF